MALVSRIIRDFLFPPSDPRQLAFEARRRNPRFKSFPPRRQVKKLIIILLFNKYFLCRTFPWILEAWTVSHLSQSIILEATLPAMISTKLRSTLRLAQDRPIGLPFMWVIMQNILSAWWFTLVIPATSEPELYHPHHCWQVHRLQDWSYACYDDLRYCPRLFARLRKSG